MDPLGQEFSGVFDSLDAQDAQDAEPLGELLGDIRDDVAALPEIKQEEPPVQQQYEGVQQVDPEFPDLSSYFAYLLREKSQLIRAFIALGLSEQDMKRDFVKMVKGKPMYRCALCDMDNLRDFSKHRITAKHMTHVDQTSVAHMREFVEHVGSMRYGYRRQGGIKLRVGALDQEALLYRRLDHHPGVCDQAGLKTKRDTRHKKISCGFCHPDDTPKWLSLNGFHDHLGTTRHHENIEDNTDTLAVFAQRVRKQYQDYRAVSTQSFRRSPLEALSETDQQITDTDIGAIYEKICVDIMQRRNGKRRVLTDARQKRIVTKMVKAGPMFVAAHLQRGAPVANPQSVKSMKETFQCKICLDQKDYRRDAFSMYHVITQSHKKAYQKSRPELQKQFWSYAKEEHLLTVPRIQKLKAWYQTLDDNPIHGARSRWKCRNMSQEYKATKRGVPAAVQPVAVQPVAVQPVVPVEDAPFDPDDLFADENDYVDINNLVEPEDRNDNLLPFDMYDLVEPEAGNADDDDLD